MNLIIVDAWDELFAAKARYTMFETTGSVNLKVGLVDTEPFGEHHLGALFGSTAGTLFGFRVAFECRTRQCLGCLFVKVFLHRHLLWQQKLE